MTPASTALKSKALKILMVGNSLTNCQNNHTIRDLKALAKKAGRRLTIRELSYNNAKLKDWADVKGKNGKKLLSEIRSRRWDYIILQEHTEAAVKKSFLDASKKISAYIRSESPKTQIIYNCTWAYKKGKKIDGKQYSCSALQKKMDESYRVAAQQTGGSVCWSGDAFLKYRRSGGAKKNLYHWDNNHASKYGWYLNACCLYKAVFGKSPAGNKYYAGLGKETAGKLQRMVWR